MKVDWSQMQGCWLDFLQKKLPYKGLYFVELLGNDERCICHWDGDTWVDKEGSTLHCWVKLWFDTFTDPATGKNRVTMAI